MNARSPNAFFLSAALHAAVLAICFLIAYTFRQETKLPEKIFELVAGEGDNFGATRAPAINRRMGPNLKTSAFSQTRHCRITVCRWSSGICRRDRDAAAP